MNRELNTRMNQMAILALAAPYLIRGGQRCGKTVSSGEALEHLFPPPSLEPRPEPIRLKAGDRPRRPDPRKALKRLRKSNQGVEA